MRRARTAPCIEWLEPRVLYAADLAGLIGALDGGHPEGSTALPDPDTLIAAARAHPPGADAPGAAEPAPAELVIIDAAVGDADRLVTDLRSHQAGRGLDIVVLDPGQDGVAQIGALLAARSQLSAVHIVSHGEAGRLQLGDSALDAQRLDADAATIGAWGRALAPGGDLMLYGCDVAAGARGVAFVESLAQLTRADVAASSDRTGHASLGGDWELEFARGHLETAVIADAATRADWVASLATFTVSNSNDAGAGSLRQAMLDANASAGADSITFAIAGHGPHTVTLASPLPTLSERVVIDATTEPGYAGAPIIEVNGGGNVSAGFVFGAGADASVLRGFAIAQFTNDGVQVNGASAVRIESNYIGTDISGTLSRGNGDAAIELSTGATDIVVTGNVLSGNAYGIKLSDESADRAIIQGNYIGVASDGTSPVGNLLNGVLFQGADDALLGGTAPGQGNVIAYNGQFTVASAVGIEAASNGISVLGNSIYAVGRLGINNVAPGDPASGVTLNDVGDADTGGNDLQNFPVLAAATTGGGALDVAGSLDSASGQTYRIEFFSSPAGQGNASGYGEGRTYLGATQVTTDLAGHVGFSVHLTGVSVPANAIVSATATVDLGGADYGSTSEFARNIVAQANQSPGITSDGGGASASVTLAENSTAVTTVTATDPDLPAQALVYAIVGGADAARFTIDATTGALAFVAAPDFEAPVDVGADNVYDVVVQVSDGLGGSDTQALAVAVTNVNEAPQAADDAYTVLEDGTLNVNPGVLVNDSDAEPGALSAVLVTGPAHGTLTLNNNGSFSYSPQTDYVGSDGFTYRAVDAGGLSSSPATVTLTITAVNDAPTLVIGGNRTVIENAPAQSVAGFATATPGGGSDEAGQTLAYVVSNDNPGLFSAQPSLDASGTLTFTPASFVSGTATVTVHVTDNGGTTSGGSDTSASRTFAITVTDVNHAPVITSDGGGASASVTLAENSTAVTTVTATDPDLPAQALVYAIVGGADAARFTIDATTGALAFVAAPDFEAPVDVGADNVYDVVVQVSDGLGGSDTQAIAVQLSDVDEFDVGAISDADFAPQRVAASAPAGAAVGLTARAVDADATNSLVTYALDADSGGRFAIDPASGVVTVAAALDAGSSGTYAIVVRATSADGSWSTRSFSIDVTGASSADGPGATPGGTGPLPPGAPVVDPVTVPSAPDARAEVRFDLPLTEVLASFTNATDAAAPRDGAGGFPGAAGGIGAAPGLAATAPTPAVDAETALSEALTQVLSDTEAWFLDGHRALPAAPPTALALRQADARAVQAGVLGADEPEIDLLADRGFTQALDRVTTELDHAATDDARRVAENVQIALGISGSLTVGFVSWVLRAGSLLASLMSVVPLWRQFDPLPILAVARRRSRRERLARQDAALDEHQVERMFDRQPALWPPGSQAAARQQPRAGQP